MQKVEAIIRPDKLEAVKDALAEAGFVGLNVVHVTGRGVQKGVVHVGRGGQRYEVDMLSKVKIALVVRDADTERAIDTVCKAARTGRIGDGKIFVTPVLDAVRVRTGERSEAAI